MPKKGAQEKEKVKGVVIGPNGQPIEKDVTLGRFLGSSREYCDGTKWVRRGSEKPKGAPVD